VKEIASFLVRIVRCDGGVLAGLVEQVRSGRTAPFANEAELTDLLSGRRTFTRAKAHRQPHDAASEDVAQRVRNAG
jgi:hypothetical protein